MSLSQTQSKLFFSCQNIISRKKLPSLNIHLNTLVMLEVKCLLYEKRFWLKLN